MWGGLFWTGVTMFTYTLLLRCAGCVGRVCGKLRRHRRSSFRAVLSRQLQKPRSPLHGQVCFAQPFHASRRTRGSRLLNCGVSAAGSDGAQGQKVSPTKKSKSGQQRRKRSPPHGHTQTTRALGSRTVLFYSATAACARANVWRRHRCVICGVRGAWEVTRVIAPTAVATCFFPRYNTLAGPFSRSVGVLLLERLYTSSLREKPCFSARAI